MCVGTALGEPGGRVGIDDIVGTIGEPLGMKCDARHHRNGETAVMGTRGQDCGLNKDRCRWL